MIRTTLILVMMAAAAAYAQPPEPGRGRFGQGPGPGPGMMQGGMRGGMGGRILGAEAGMPGRVVKNAPYSADIVTETTQVLPDGNRIRQTSTVRVSRDSDGRTRREQSLRNLNGLAPNANLPEVVFITDPVAGVNYALNPTDKSATRTTWRVREAASSGMAPRQAGPRGPGANAPRPAVPGQPRMPRRQNPNITTESLGQQTIEGVVAEGTRTTMTIPAGEVGNDQPMVTVTETWYSPELQTELLYKRTDPRTGETVRRLSNVTRAEPSRIQFEPPADYKISDAGGRMGRGPGGPAR